MRGFSQTQGVPLNNKEEKMRKDSLSSDLILILQNLLQLRQKAEVAPQRAWHSPELISIN